MGRGRGQAGCRAAVRYTGDGFERRFRKPAHGLGKRDPPSHIVPGTALGTDEDHAPDFPGGLDGSVPARTGIDKRGMKTKHIPAGRAGMEFVLNRQADDFLEIGHRVLLIMHWKPDRYQRFLRLTIADDEIQCVLPPVDRFMELPERAGMNGHGLLNLLLQQVLRQRPARQQQYRHPCPRSFLHCSAARDGTVSMMISTGFSKSSASCRVVRPPWTIAIRARARCS